MRPDETTAVCPPRGFESSEHALAHLLHRNCSELSRFNVTFEYVVVMRVRRHKGGPSVIANSSRSCSAGVVVRPPGSDGRAA